MEKPKKTAAERYSKEIDNILGIILNAPNTESAVTLVTHKIKSIVTIAYYEGASCGIETLSNDFNKSGLL